MILGIVLQAATRQYSFTLAAEAVVASTNAAEIAPNRAICKRGEAAGAELACFGACPVHRDLLLLVSCASGWRCSMTRPDSPFGLVIVCAALLLVACGGGESTGSTLPSTAGPSAVSGTGGVSAEAPRSSGQATALVPPPAPADASNPVRPPSVDKAEAARILADFQSTLPARSSATSGTSPKRPGVPSPSSAASSAGPPKADPHVTLRVPGSPSPAMREQPKS